MNHPTLIILGLLLAPLLTYAADAPQPPVKVTQQVLNAIRSGPQPIFNPFSANAERYLPSRFHRA